MNRTDVSPTVLFTGIPSQRQEELDALGVPYEHLDLPARRSRQMEWNSLGTFLNSRAPCIYIPNFDFHRSCAAGTFTNDVRVCGVIHSDEDCYYDELKRVGAEFDVIVAVSSLLKSNIKRRFPHLADRTIQIPYGIPLPHAPDARPKETNPLRLAYCNRLQQYQKRVFDLTSILGELRRLGIQFYLTIAGDGPDFGELRKRLAEFEDSGAVTFLGRISNAAVIDVLRSAHVFLLTSDFEGLPISLLEAMSVGCVPVVYQIDSGINEAISHGETGLIVPHGDTGAFASALARLQHDPAMTARLSSAAAARVRECFSLTRMCAEYEELFSRLLAHDSDIPRPRRSGFIRVPRDLTLGFRVKRRLASILGR